MNSSVQTRAAAPAIEDAREAILAALGAAAATGPRLTPEASKEIRAATKVEDGWSLVKLQGIRGFGRGDAATRGETLLADLRRFGLFLVTPGELEGWHPTISNKGPEWLVEVISQGLHATAGPHREFVQDIVRWLDTDAPEAPPS